MNSRISAIFTLAAILVLAAFFRFTGLNYDQNQHLHPDERFLTMVATTIRWPQSVGAYFDTAHSTLNPHNNGFGFFVYGTFPIFLTKFVADSLGRGNYVNMTLVGRFLSALTDIATVIAVFFITKRVGKRNAAAFLASFFYALSVLPIQLAHFFTTDPYVTYFSALSLLILLVPFSKKQSVLLGISVGLAVASKVSALLILPVVLLYMGSVFLKKRTVKTVLLWGILFAASLFLTIRVTYPYLFAGPGILSLKLNSLVLANWQELKGFDTPQSGFPPSVQWVGTTPYLFPLTQMIAWGLGLPLGILMLFAVIAEARFVRRSLPMLILFSFIAVVFAYQGAQFAKAMRYFAPLYPAIAVVSGVYAERMIRKYRSAAWIHPILLLLCSLWPLAFLSIYRVPHTRVTASHWIYQNVPNGSVIAVEHWDDPLPLLLENEDKKYATVQLTLFDPESPKNWDQIAAVLSQTQYIVLTSNRLYGSIPRMPNRYPITTRYYQALFAGSLGFTKVAEFTSRPNLPIPFVHACFTPPYFAYGSLAQDDRECPLPGVSVVDDYAEEFFTVYDHPKVIVFQKTFPIDYSAYFVSEMRKE